MKRELYNLTDEEFAFFVNNLHKQTKNRKISYVLVGGTAVQAHVLNRLCNKTGKNLEQIISDPNIRVQDFIRSTDDIDIALDSSIAGKKGEMNFAEDVMGLLKDLTGEDFSPSEEHILEYRLARTGIKRPVFQIYVDGETDDEQRIAMNIGRNKSDLKNLDSKYYDKFVKEGQEIVIPYNSQFNINTRVIKPEHLLASKISKFRAKDTMDLHMLADCMTQSKEKIDLVETRSILSPDYSDNYNRFLELVKLKDPD